MSIYAIGDVQGCHDELCRLLERIRFDPGRDRLWFTGDLVNRGPHSLKVLQLVRGLGTSAVTVLGNHDLHLVSAALTGAVRVKDTFQDVLRSPERDALIAWLRRLPLLHVGDGVAMVHAGLPPQWSLAQAQRLCTEASRILASRSGDAFLRRHMYGNEPSRWSPHLQGHNRLRFIINACTRTRVCSADGDLQMDHKGPPPKNREPRPWFRVAGRKTAGQAIVFGHWSLLGKVRWPREGVFGLDTGCVWGGRLTALRLEDRRLFSVPGHRYSVPD